MNTIIFTYKFLSISILDLFLLVIVITSGVLLSKYINKENKNKTSRSQKTILQVIVWFFVAILVSLLIIPAFSQIFILKNKYVNIKLLSIGIIIIIFFVNTFIINIIKQWFLKQNQKNKSEDFKIFHIFIWLISSYIILKLILVDFSKFSGKIIFSIKDTNITIADILLVSFILLGTAFIIKMIKIGLDKLVKIKKLDETNTITLLNISKYFIWTFAILFALETIGFNLSLVLAGSAALLVGIGMGIQQVFNDFASGIILLFERQIKVKDYIETEEINGKVLEIGFRTTTILTRDHVRVIIPNSKLVSNSVINWTNGEKFARIGLQIGVAYNSDVQKVRKILLDCASTHIDARKNPPPEVFFNNFGDSSLDFTLYIYTENTFNRNKIKSDLRFKIYEEFNNNKISIPFPQIDVHLPK